MSKLVRIADNSIVLTRQNLKSDSLGLRNEQRGENTQEHKESIDLQHVVEPRVGICLGGTADTERSNSGLCNDGANFAGCSGDTVRCRAVTCREAFTGDDESGCIWPEIEKLGHMLDTK
jgi:hypothetical protein